MNLRIARRLYQEKHECFMDFTVFFEMLQSGLLYIRDGVFFPNSAGEKQALKIAMDYDREVSITSSQLKKT